MFLQFDSYEVKFNFLNKNFTTFEIFYSNGNQLATLKKLIIWINIKFREKAKKSFDALILYRNLSLT